jgi:hypothetical protein
VWPEASCSISLHSSFLTRKIRSSLSNNKFLQFWRSMVIASSGRTPGGKGRPSVSFPICSPRHHQLNRTNAKASHPEACPPLLSFLRMASPHGLIPKRNLAIILDLPLLYHSHKITSSAQFCLLIISWICSVFSIIATLAPVQAPTVCLLDYCNTLQTGLPASFLNLTTSPFTPLSSQTKASMAFLGLSLLGLQAFQHVFKLECSFSLSHFSV